MSRTIRRSLASAPLLAIALAMAPGAPVLAASPEGEASSAVTLVWTAPGDDGDAGVAAAYSLRYALAPITEASFAAATPVNDVPRPSRAGQRERVKVTGLVPETLYYFAIKAVDEAGNWSRMSNVALRTAPDATGPLRLSLAPPRPNPARGLTVIRLSLSRDTEVLLRVFDAAGRQVVTLARRQFPAGTTDIAWRMQDSEGAALGNGLYWIRAVVGDLTEARPLIIVR